MPLDPRYVSTFQVFDVFDRPQTLSIGAEDGRVISKVSGTSSWWKSDGTEIQELAIQSAWYGAAQLAKMQRGPES